MKFSIIFDTAVSKNVDIHVWSLSPWPDMSPFGWISFLVKTKLKLGLNRFYKHQFEHEFQNTLNLLPS